MSLKGSKTEGNLKLAKAERSHANRFQKALDQLND